MGKPTKQDLEAMDFSYQAQPFVNVATKPELELLDFSYQAQPFLLPLTGPERRSSFLIFFG